MKRIKFVTGGFPFGDAIYINPSYYMLKTYHDHFGKSQYHWLDANYYIHKSLDAYIEELLHEDFDILCAGVYCWNNIFFMSVLERIKKQKNCIIIAGGPDVTARTEKDWFKRHSFVDYVVYGDGEKAFSNLLDHLEGHVDINTIPNLIYSKDGKAIINPHQIMREKEYWALSPWQHCKDLLQRDVIKIVEHGYIPAVMWERSRGCPYSCSFCDFSSGLHNKVSRRTNDFREDVDLIADTHPNVEINDIDPNVGMIDEDFEIIKYILDKEKVRQRKFINISILSWSKLNKEKVFRILDFIIDSRYDATSENIFKISQQDMHDDILANINRPSIPWHVHKEVLLEKKRKSNKIVYSFMELMIGLPGQTRETWNYNIRETAHFSPIKIVAHPWQLLPYAPASQVNYLTKFKISTTKAFIPSYNTMEFNFLKGRNFRDSFLEKLIQQKGIMKSKWILIDMVTGSYSFSFEDLIYFHVKTKLFNENRLDSISETEIENLTKINHSVLADDIQKHGIILFTIFTK